MGKSEPGWRSLAALAMVLALTSPAAAQQRDAEARVVFDRGTERMNEGHYLEAAHLYERAYELSPRALILLNVSTAYERALELSAAADALEQYLDSSDAPEDEAVLRRRLARLRRLALLEQSASPSATPEVDATDAPTQAPAGSPDGTPSGAPPPAGADAGSASPAIGPGTPAQPSPGTVGPAAPAAGASPGSPSVGPGQAVGVGPGVGAGVEGEVQPGVGVGQPVAAPARAPAIEPRPLVTWTSMPEAAPAAAAPAAAAPAAAVAAEPAAPMGPEPSRPANGWGVFAAVTGGLGLVSAVIGVAVGGLALADVQSACGDSVCPSSASGTIDEARTLTDVADVFGGVGASLGAIAITAMIIAIAQGSGGSSEPSEDDEDDAGSEVRVRVAPFVIEGSF